MTSQPHLENRIPIHQAHSRFFGESQSPDSGCAKICRTGTARHHRKERKKVFGLFCLAGSEKQSAVSTGWLPVSAMIGSGDNDTPVQPNVRALKRFAAVIRRRQWGRLRENHARGEIPRGAGELPAV